MFYRRPQIRKPVGFPPTPAPGQQDPSGGLQLQGEGMRQGADNSGPPAMRPSGMPSLGSPPSMTPGGMMGNSAQQAQAEKDQMARMKAKRQGQMDALSGMGM